VYSSQRRWNFWENAPTRALMGYYKDAIPTELNFNMRKLIGKSEKISSDPIMQGTINRFLDTIEGQMYVNDTLTTLQSNILELAEMGGYKTENSVLNSFNYIKDVWTGAIHEAAVAQAGTRARAGHLKKKKLKGMTEEERLAQAGLSEHKALFLDPRMAAGMAVAAVRQSMALFRLVEEFITNGEIRPGNSLYKGGQTISASPGSTHRWIKLDVERLFGGNKWANEMLFAKYGDMYMTAEVADLFELRGNSIKRIKKAASDWTENGPGLILDLLERADWKGPEMRKLAYVRDRAFAVAPELVGTAFDGLASAVDYLVTSTPMKYVKSRMLFYGGMRLTSMNILTNHQLLAAHAPEMMVPGTVAGSSFYKGWKIYSQDVFAGKLPKDPIAKELAANLLADRILGTSRVTELGTTGKASATSFNFLERELGMTRAVQEFLLKPFDEAKQRLAEQKVKLKTDPALIDDFNAMGEKVAQGLLDMGKDPKINSWMYKLLYGTGANKVPAAVRSRLKALTAGARREVQNPVKAAGKTGAAIFDFPFIKGTPMEAWPNFVMEWFRYTDDVYKFSYAYSLRMQYPDMPYTEIANRVRNFMPDYTRAGGLMRTSRVVNPFSWFPLKTIANGVKLMARKPLRTSAMSHYGWYGYTMDWGESTLEEWMTEFLRDSRNRGITLRTPFGNFGLSHALFTGDLDMMLNINHNLYLRLVNEVIRPNFPGMGGMWKTASGQERHVGATDTVPAWVNRLIHSYDRFRYIYGPRLGFDPARFFGNIPHYKDAISAYASGSPYASGTSVQDHSFSDLLRSIVSKQRGGPAFERARAIAGEWNPRTGKFESLLMPGREHAEGLATWLISTMGGIEKLETSLETLIRRNMGTMMHDTKVKGRQAISPAMRDLFQGALTMSGNDPDQAVHSIVNSLLANEAALGDYLRLAGATARWIKLLPEAHLTSAIERARRGDLDPQNLRMFAAYMNFLKANREAMEPDAQMLMEDIDDEN
jgi:hypothetical protein